MSAVISLSEAEASSIGASGRSGAALANAVQEGYPIARGFVITSEAFDAFLRNSRTAHAWSAHLAAMGGRKGQVETLENLQAAFHEARLYWDDEMEIIRRFREIGGMVTLHLSTVSGQPKAPLHAVTETGLMGCIREMWARWVEGANTDELQGEYPALIVQEVIESESSIEVKRQKDGFSARAVFGQPEGLYDSTISSDHYRFDNKLNLVGSEDRPQKWQHIPLESEVAKVEVMEDFQEDPKISDEVLENLVSIMSYMMEREEIEAVILTVVDEELVIDDIISSPIAEKMPLAIDRRRHTHFLMPGVGAGEAPESPATIEPEKPEAHPAERGLHSEPATVPAQQPSAQPAASGLKTKIYVKAVDVSQLRGLRPEGVEGVIFLGEWYRPDAGSQLSEVSRLFSDSKLIIELPPDPATEEAVVSAAQKFDVGFMLPPNRTMDEFEKFKMRLAAQTGARHPDVWAQVVYPSNLFFYDRLASEVEAASVDLEKLALHLIGSGHDPGSLARYDSNSIGEALSHLLSRARSKNGRISVHSPDFAGLPGLLERLIREGTDILCVAPEEFGLVKQVAVSVEERMLRERG